MAEKKSLKMVQNSNWCHFYESKFFCDTIKKYLQKKFRSKSQFCSTKIEN